MDAEVLIADQEWKLKQFTDIPVLPMLATIGFVILGLQISVLRCCLRLTISQSVCLGLREFQMRM
jgi:hypothetical protein